MTSNSYSNEIAQKIAGLFAPPIVSAGMNILVKAKKETEASKSQTQVTSVPHVTSSEYRIYSPTQEQEKKIAQNIAGKIAPTIVKDVMGKIIDKVKKETEASKSQTQVTSVPHVTSSEYRIYSPTQEQEKKIAQNIAGKIAPTIAGTVIGKMIEKIKKETVEIPATREARIDEAMHQLSQQTQLPVQTMTTIAGMFAPPIVKDAMGNMIREEIPKIVEPPGLREKIPEQGVPIHEPVKLATPISPDEVPGKKIEIAFAGGVASILARVGTALWDFVAKNPKTIGATISSTALADAISRTAQTEGEKNQILWEIAQQNPQLTSQIAKEMSQTKANPFANLADMGKYVVVGIGLLLLYFLLKKK